MARLARVKVVDVPYHVTQRGNARQYILAGDGERQVYLDLLRQYAQLHDPLATWLLSHVQSRALGGDSAKT